MTEKNKVDNTNQSQNTARRNYISYDLFILVLTVFSMIVVGALVVGPGISASNAILWRVDFFICVIFFIDFLRTLRQAPSKRHYFFNQGGWLDLLGSIPVLQLRPWMALLRLARLNRLVRIVRHLQNKDREEMLEEAREKPAQTALLTVILAAFVLITGASLLILLLERGAAGAQIRTGPDAFWWSLVTVTTVGYGDYTPVTFPGRVLASILMIFGIGIFAVLTSFVAARVGGQDDADDTVAIIKEENALIRTELAEIKALLKERELRNDSEE
jgi:voltage-gated potassium channel